MVFRFIFVWLRKRRELFNQSGNEVKQNQSNVNINNININNINNINNTLVLITKPACAC